MWKLINICCFLSNHFHCISIQAYTTLIYIYKVSRTLELYPHVNALHFIPPVLIWRTILFASRIQSHIPKRHEWRTLLIRGHWTVRLCWPNEKKKYRNRRQILILRIQQMSFEIFQVEEAVCWFMLCVLFVFCVWHINSKSFFSIPFDCVDKERASPCIERNERLT